MTVTMETECRRCPECLRKRAAFWRYRAIAECENAERTWFATLTASPEIHYQWDLRAAGRSPNFDKLTNGEKFRSRAEIMGIELTKYLKRVRKNSGSPFRYLAVTEIHESRKTSPEMRGRPHLHLLVHETALPIRKALLEDCWGFGFTKFKLVQTGPHAAANYLCKYISKAMDARIRASIDYGNYTTYSRSVSTTVQRFVTDPSPIPNKRTGDETDPKEKEQDGRASFSSVAPATAEANLHSGETEA